jgi:hypothetical protein
MQTAKYERIYASFIAQGGDTVRDPVEHRVRAAFRCVDAITSATVSDGLTVISRQPIWQNLRERYCSCICADPALQVISRFKFADAVIVFS